MHQKISYFAPLSPSDFERIRGTRERILAAAKAPNTRSTYRSGWRIFERWCIAAEHAALPAERATVEEFMLWSIADGYRLGTVAVRLSAIAAMHIASGYSSPIDEQLRELLSCARREIREDRRGKRALTYELLARVAMRLPHTPGGIRDRAMVLTGFASGWRRSEIVAIALSHVEFCPEGFSLWQPRSKTDQRSEGRLVGIARGTEPGTCPVRALEAWLAVRGKWEGPLFVRLDFRGQLTRQAIGQRGERLAVRLKEELASLGEDPAHYGAHSLRAGMITEAAKAGATEAAIMQRTGHRSRQTLLRYIRPATIFDFDPLKNVL
ncbi:MAG: tyrosine-type recombinase/integrase [Terriglobia bacterium]